MKSQAIKREVTERLIADCIAQKRKAQHQLFKSYYGLMMSIALRYAHDEDEAQDMLNEGFIKVFANLDKYQNTGSFEGWMRKVMVNTALDYLRKNSHHYETLSYDAINEDENEIRIENEAMQNLTYNELMRCIQKLPTMSRNVFNLYVFEDYTHAEIAEILGMKEGTSHWHLNFARKKLKEEIKHIV
ncbi:sigma-70 family RNA polymerase sigma factor [Bacteroidales bacterium OttesenSCG-928-B11]|nr:sigma-70 family RNA polymerase sigma factor [Bacteroidales bacterium OttesenSCG-928-C03]MDL2312861.1 sigma-70 family RNA polymerase sigma factor [Bacteroidales bacterium OttesenSCG-928-B11]MDL2325863.1 sigma-70 family RNA polymerase sigma factor [Bacteroidales bacterium OttesenSCG-928-A14]